LAWLSGKKLTLFDDALISGTSLYQTIDRLRKSGINADDIRTQVLCVNTDWHSEELVKPELPYLELSNDQTASLCARIVEAISVVPRPYAVDYPLYKNIRMPRTGLDLMTSLDGWSADEVTTPIQASQDVFTITFTPNQRVLSQLDRELGWIFSDRSLIKVRLYGRLVKRDRQHCWCCMFPVVAMEPLRLDTVAQLFESVSGHSGDKQAFSRSFTPDKTSGMKRSQVEASSRLRLISFLASARLARIWLNDMAEFFPDVREPLEDMRAYSYLFPPAVGEPIRRLCAGKEKLFEFAPQPTVHSHVPRVLVRPASTAPLPDQISIEKDLAGPFLRLYRDKELKARRLALKYGRRVFDRVEYRYAMNRLRTGLPLPAIRHSIEHLKGLVDIDRLASLFIDRAIDRGAVVPITCVAGQRVYRAYRHGEDVEFGEAEERLCVQMLASISHASGRTELPHMWVEKSLVLLIRIGLEQQFFNAWEHTLGDFKSMGIRYSLHGAVVGTGSNKLYHTVSHYGLTELMQKHRYLTRTTRAPLWRVAAVPAGGTHADRAAKVKLIGALLGRLLVPQREGSAPLLSERDLTLLATCLYAKDVAGALAAEVDAAARDWALRPSVGQTISIASMDPVEADELAAELRKSTAFFAANNGLWKVASFNAGKPWAIIQAVSDALEDPIYKSAWESFFPKGGQQGKKSIPKNLLDLIESEAFWLWRVKTHLGLLECALRYQAIRGTAIAKIRKQTLDRRARQLQRALSELKQSASEASKIQLHGATIAKAVQRLEKGCRDNDLNVDAVRDFASKHLEGCISESRAILTEVDSIAAAFGRPEDLSYYNHILHIELEGRSIGEESPWRNVFATFHQTRGEARGAEKPTILAEIELNQCEIKRGMWVVATGPMSRVWLTRLALRVISLHGGKYKVHCTLFANMARTSALVKAGKSSHYNGPLFWENASAIIEQLPWADESNYWVVVNGNEVNPRTVNQEVLGEGRRAKLELLEERDVQAPGPMMHPLNAYRYGSDVVKNKERKQSKATVGILTVVADEMKAITAFLSDEEQFAQREGSRHLRDFCEASLPGRDGSRHQVAVTRAIEQGNRSIMSAYQALMDEYNPKLVILIGIGGGIHKDARACDVVIADSVFYYDKRAETPEGSQHRLLGYRIEPFLLRFINRFFDKYGEVAELPSAPNSPDASFRIHLGPIGTGEAVVKYRDAEVRKWLHIVNDKTLALETEAGGVAQQFAEDSLRFGLKASGYLVMRGISDHADHAKDDRWRIAATTNAMKALKALLSSIPSDLTGESQTQ
jgi:nucleoside phosphorylase